MWTRVGSAPVFKGRLEGSVVPYERGYNGGDNFARERGIYQQRGVQRWFI